MSLFVLMALHSKCQHPQGIKPKTLLIVRIPLYLAEELGLPPGNSVVPFCREDAQFRVLAMSNSSLQLTRSCLDAACLTHS